ncbi:MAG TPA: HNH endonuclease [Sphingopyxis sp.]|uniref:HNH endonuclease n=1 Tax=Sphingopyxis sp. TaxID=1908224 RepID=UPI002C2062CA|nr:HNH endonuclease [Sphingopyxis sp.]HWW55402.1 HNH endonuclease [Sphingopyxis sp.]
MYFTIGPDGEQSHDARIELHGQSVVLHSRGGATGGRPARNTSYALALIEICRRSGRLGKVLDRVLIDSAPARHLPESERLLVDRVEIASLRPDELAREIRVRMRRFGQAKGTKGGNSTKQIRFDFRLPSAEIIEMLGLRREEAPGKPQPPSIVPLTAKTQGRVTTLQIREAVDRLVAGSEASNFPETAGYELIATGGTRLAPEKVFGLALEIALGIKVFPGHFNVAPGQTSFELLEAAGFRMVPKSDDRNYLPANRAGDDALPDPDEQEWAEGDVKLSRHLRTERRRDPAAAAAKRDAVRREHDGKLICENPACAVDWYDIFPVAVAESVFEIHHATPVATMSAGHRTTVADLKCLCASCHRAEHRRMSLETSAT